MVCVIQIAFAVRSDVSSKAIRVLHLRRPLRIAAHARADRFLR